MKNFSTFYSKIDAIVEGRSTKKERGKGLLAPEKQLNKSLSKSTKRDIHEKIADYIEAIRKQKKDMLNGD